MTTAAVAVAAQVLLATEQPHIDPLLRKQNTSERGASIFICFWVFLFHDFTPYITISMSFASYQTITILGRDV